MKPDWATHTMAAEEGGSAEDPRPPFPPGAFHVHRSPPPALRHLVLRYTGYAETTGHEIRQVETASLVVPVIVSFAERFRIGLGREPGEADAVPSFVAGLYAGPVHIRSSGRAACLQIDFTPPGARRFLGTPLREFTAQMVALDLVGSPELRELARRLEDTPDWSRRLDIAEAFVASRLAGGAPSRPELTHAYRRLAAARGRLRVEALAGEIGWSRKHLTVCFEREFGLPPKAVAGIARFEEARRRALVDPFPDWADIAAASGYADQAHMIRDFRRYAGLTPGGWLPAPR